MVNMLFKKSTEYALKVLSLMARESQDKFFGTKELSERINVSSTYLSKILQKLQHAGFVTSTTGPGGGFCMGSLTADKKISDVVRALENDELFTSCALGMSVCGHDNPCPLHEKWAIFRNEIQEYMETVTIKDSSENFWPAFDRIAKN